MTNFSYLSNFNEIIERFYTFLEKKNELIYSFQFGFRQQHSNTCALIHLRQLIRKQLDGGNYGCGIFVDFEKAFDTVDHGILRKKVEHYDIEGIVMNGLHLVLVIENNLCQWMVLMWIWLTLALKCFRVLYWILYSF